MIKFHHFRHFLIKIFLFNIQSLIIEMFKVINNIAATITDDLCTTYHSYNLFSESKFCFSKSACSLQSITVKVLYSITVLLSGI